MKSPELLMPAGSLQKLKYAFAHGADAVYMGVPLYSLRARENDVGLAELTEGIAHARALGKAVYITVNIFARNRKLGAFPDRLRDWLALKPDALIMSDPGLIAMTREIDASVPIHLSVQANCMNWQSVKFWRNALGVSRVILSRELGIAEIAEIKNRVPDIELEAFVHGAICIAYSGRCLMSSYMSHRDANQGVCDNSCREKYRVFAEDLRSPGQLYELAEDQEGTYLFNAKDLCVIRRLRELREAGVCSFKVEGRTKSVNYAALVARAYRRAIDDMMRGCEFDPTLIEELQKIPNRGYHEGFFHGAAGPEGQNYVAGRASTHVFAGLLLPSPSAADDLVAVEARGTFHKGDTLEILGPEMYSETFMVTEILNSRREVVETAHSGAGVHWIRGPRRTIPYGILNLVRTVS